VSNVTEPGTIFVRDGAPLPKTLRIESEPYASGWRLVKDLDGDGLGRKIQDTGWTFFCLAGQIRATAFGRGRQQGAQSAVLRMLAKLKSEKFNSLEITRVVSKRFFGLPYVTVSARSRHIQDGVFLFRDTGIQEWDRTNLAAA
jgi:hypothetical protein